MCPSAPKYFREIKTGDIRSGDVWEKGCLGSFLFFLKEVLTARIVNFSRLIFSLHVFSSSSSSSLSLLLFLFQK